MSKQIITYLTMALALVAMATLLPGCPADDACLTDGEYIEVEVEIKGDGSLYAAEVEGGEAEDEAEGLSEINGPVTAIAPSGESFEMLDGAITVIHEPSGEDEDDDDDPGDEPDEYLSIADLTVGMWIEAEGTLGADGVFVAGEMEAADEQDIEVQSTVSEVTDSSFVLLGLTFSYNDNTEFECSESDDDEEDCHEDDDEDDEHDDDDDDDDDEHDDDDDDDDDEHDC